MPGVRVRGETEGPIQYRVRIAGVEDAQLVRELKGVSVTESLSDRPPDTVMQLERRVAQDLVLFQQVLRNHGYYDARVTSQIDLERRRPQVRFEVTPGPVYRLRHVRLTGEREDVAMPSAEEIGLRSGERALASEILDANGRIIRSFRNRGYARVRVVSREVRVIHAAYAVDVDFEVAVGEMHLFGATHISGLDRVEGSFLHRKIPWEEGDRFEGALLAQFRRRLSGADLFSTIRVEEDPEFEGEALPILVEVNERRHRSVLLGFGYGNDEGWRVRAGWEHRNFFERGERLSVDYAVSERGYEGDVSFRRPDVRRVDQNLTLSFQQSVEDTSAFRSERLGVLARMDRLTGDNRVWGAGVGFRFAAVRDSVDSKDYHLLYVPLSMEQDRSDDPLDPRRGTRLALGLAPYWDVLDQEIFFVKTRASLSAYYPLRERWDLDWAGRVSATSLWGEARRNIPADERLYAGGGGTLRGYRFQFVGPLEDGVPTGGRSQFLLSQELRWRWRETLGLVGFVDGGAVTEEVLFDPTVDDLRWGAGVGFRYFTPVGPIRLDIAFPLNRRQGIDDPWQFYISLGQAF